MEPSHIRELPTEKSFITSEMGIDCLVQTAAQKTCKSNYLINIYCEYGEVDVEYFYFAMQSQCLKAST